MPTSPVSGGAQVPKPQLVKYLVQRGLTETEAQRVADTVDSGSSPVQFKDGQIVTDGSGVSVSLSDGSLSKEELAAMGFTPQNEADEALIHGWAQNGSDGYQAEGTAEAGSIEAEDLGQMFADVQEYANTYEIEFDKALSIYLGEDVNLSRQSMAEVKANRQACVQEHSPNLQIVLDGAVDRDAAVLDWAVQTFDILEGDPVLQNLTSYLISHEQTSSQDIIKQLLLYAFASKFSANIQTTVLGLSAPITRPYQGNYDATSLVAWYKNEQPAASAASVAPATAASTSGAPASQPAAQSAAEPPAPPAAQSDEQAESASAQEGESVMEFESDGAPATDGPYVVIQTAEGPSPVVIVAAESNEYQGSLTATKWILGRRHSLELIVGDWTIGWENGHIVATNPAGDRLVDNEIRDLYRTAFGPDNDSGELYSVLEMIKANIKSSASVYIGSSQGIDLYASHNDPDGRLALYVPGGTHAPAAAGPAATHPAAATQVAQAGAPDQTSIHPGGTLTDLPPDIEAPTLPQPPAPEPSHIAYSITGTIREIATVGGVIGNATAEQIVLLYGTGPGDTTLQQLAEYWSITDWYEVKDAQGALIGWLPVNANNMAALTGQEITEAVSMPSTGATPEEAIAIADDLNPGSGPDLDATLAAAAPVDAQPEAENAEMTFTAEEIQAGGLLSQARDEYLTVLGNVHNDPQGSLPVLQHAAELYRQAIAILPEGQERTDAQELLDGITGMIATIEAPETEETAVAVAEPEAPAAPVEYNFSDDLVAGNLLENLEHQQRRPILSAIIRDRQPVAPAVVEEPTMVAAAEPAPVEDIPTPTPVTVVAETNGNSGGVVYGAPAFAPVPEPVPAPVVASEPERIIDTDDGSDIPFASPAPAPAVVAEAPAPAAPAPTAPAVESPAPAVAAAPAVVEPPVAPPPSDPLIVNNYYLAAAQNILDAINSGGAINQNAFYSDVISSNLARISGDYDEVQSFVDKLRSKLLATISNISIAESSGSPINGFAPMIREALIALGQAMQTQDTRSDDLAAYDKLIALNESYQYFSEQCDVAENKYNHNDLAGAIAIYVELMARPDCPDFIAARRTALVAEAGAAEQAVAVEAQQLAETKAKAIADHDFLLAFANEHPELVSEEVAAALGTALTAINAPNATQSQLSVQRGRLLRARQYLEARLEMNSGESTPAGAAQGGNEGLLLTAAMINSDAILKPADGCAFPTSGNSNQLMARWNLIVGKIVGATGLSGTIELHINPTTGQLRLLVRDEDGNVATRGAWMIPDPDFHPSASFYPPIEGEPGWLNVKYVLNNNI